MFTKKDYYLIQKLRDFKNYEAIEAFLDQAEILIKALKLDTDTPNFLCALPEVSRNMNIQFTNKIIIAVKFSTKTPMFEYILPNNGHEYYSQKGLNVKDLGELELLDDGTRPIILGFEDFSFEIDVKNLWLETAKKALKSYKTNSKKNKFNYELYKLITNNEYKLQIMEFAQSDKKIPLLMQTTDDMMESKHTPAPLNQILFGPPGTGKTYKLHHEYFNEFTTENNKNYKLVTFHQNFAYEDFIEGIKPILNNQTLQYKIERGIFYEACEEAVLLAGYKNLATCLQDTKENRQEKIKNAPRYCIFIDEINRANVSNVFGELITLIEEDKRLGATNEITEIILPYSKESFGVPANLHIICTMNTADRSVEALDTALRRRFSFVEMPPKPALLDTDCEGINLQTLLIKINQRIAKLLSKDHLIGHSFFINLENLQELKSVFHNKIIPLLQEYFFGDYGKIGLVLGNGFVKIENTKGDIFAPFDYEDVDFIAENKIYCIENIIEMDNDNFAIALQTLLGK